MNENIIVAITKLNEIVTDIDKDDTCFLDIKDTVEEVIALLKAKDINVPTKWVSVKDRLPTHGEYVLTLDSQGNYYIDQVLRDGRWQETENEWNPVKWWTPLPEPPKEDDGE